MKTAIKIAITCEHCGNIFYKRKNDLKFRASRFCCRECYDEYRRTHLTTPDKSKSKVARTCVICGSVFYANKYDLNRRTAYCCSRECYYKLKAKKCESRLVTHVCEICGKEFSLTPYRDAQANTHYCSKECLSKSNSIYRAGENSPSWKGGLSFEPYCILFNNEFKERVRAFFDNKCAVCGKTKEENGRSLCIHHVNYDKKTCCNDSERLFVPLCGSCHSKTNHNREEWEEYFKDLIKNEYGGKCYYTKEEYYK